MSQESERGESSPGPGAWATHAALLLVQLSFASQTVEAKIAMLPRAAGGEEIFPEALAMIRMIGGALFFQIASRAIVRDKARLGVGLHLKLAGLSLLGVALNQALFLAGLRFSSPFVTALLGATIPVFAAGLAVILRRERGSWRTAIGIGLSVSGVLWLTGAGSVSSQDSKGALLVTLNSLSYAGYIVLSRDVVLRIAPLRFIAWVFTYGALLFVPVGLVPMFRELGHLTSRGWFFVGYIVLVPTIIAYALNVWALRRSSATLVTVYIYTQPLLAAALARIQLGSTIPARALLAAALIFGGLLVVATRRSS